MSKKFNNRNLLIIVVILAGVFVVARMTKFKNSSRTLNTEIVSIDTSRVTSMLLYPTSEKGNELIFSRKDGRWTVTRDDLTAACDRAAVDNALSELVNLKTDQLVARSKDKWNDYNASDSLGSRLVVKEGKKTTLDLVIGRFNYIPSQNPYGGYGQNQGTGITYVREHNRDEVYATQGFLAMTFNRNFNSWRDQTITSFTPSQVSKIVFDYPADSGFIVQKSGTGWMVGGLPADSASMANYLNRASRKRNANFSDDNKPNGTPDYQVTFEGENMKPVNVQAFIQAGGNYIFHSTANPDSWFNVTGDQVFKDIFKSADALMPEGTVD